MEFSALDINASALTAQRLRMDTIAGNLANINTTRKPDGTVGAYRRKEVVFAPILYQAMNSGGPIDRGGKYGPHSPGGIELSPNVAGVQFNSSGTPMLMGGVSHNEGAPAQGVQVAEIIEDQQNPVNLVYNPGHPDANADGYVETPNINVVSEMVDMMAATRAYEANLTAISNFKTMFKATMQI